MNYQKLTTQEKSLVESQVTNNQRNIIVAYLLWFFGGSLGLHRFYLKRGFDFVALTQLGLNILGWLTVWIFIGAIFFFVLGAWLLVDAFLIPGMVKKDIDAIREEYAKDIVEDRNFQEG